jgi:hypothetical protein
MKALADFFRRPLVYRTLILILVLGFLYIEVIAPLAGGFWSPRQPTMLDGWIMRGR